MPKFDFNKIALRSVKLNKSMFFPFDFQRWRLQFLPLHTAQKIKFFIENFFSRCDQICSFLQIWSHLLRKSLMENLIFQAVALHT